MPSSFGPFRSNTTRDAEAEGVMQTLRIISMKTAKHLSQRKASCSKLTVDRSICRTRLWSLRRTDLAELSYTSVSSCDM